MRSLQAGKADRLGELYVPNVLDSQNDWATPEEVENMAYGFLQKGLTDHIDLNHDGNHCGAYVVESFIARENDPAFIPGSWVVGVKVPDADQWNLIKTGELNGFSLEGIGQKKTTEVEFYVPPLMKGETDEVEDHVREFSVSQRLVRDEAFPIRLWSGMKAQMSLRKYLHLLGCSARHALWV